MVTKWFLQVGSVADQSFAKGGHDKLEGALLYIGDGDYSDFFTDNPLLELK